MAEQHSNHGNTIAAWATVGLLMVAALILCLAVGFAEEWLAIPGLVLIAVALVTGKVLAGRGYGMVRPDDNRVTRGVR